MKLIFGESGPRKHRNRFTVESPSSRCNMILYSVTELLPPLIVSAQVHFLANHPREFALSEPSAALSPPSGGPLTSSPAARSSATEHSFSHRFRSPAFSGPLLAQLHRPPRPLLLHVLHYTPSWYLPIKTTSSSDGPVFIRVVALRFLGRVTVFYNSRKESAHEGMQSRVVSLVSWLHKLAFLWCRGGGSCA